MQKYSIRIEHGNLKGFKVSDGFFGVGSRITTSANRCVLFNILINKFYLDFKNLTCADFCCGSGIVGFELLSLGCKSCDFVDCDRKKINNVKEVLSRGKLNGSFYCCYLPYFQISKTFDIIFFDPPYENDFDIPTIANILTNNILSKNGILIFETKNDINIDFMDNIYTKQLKNGAKFYFYQHK